MTSPASRLPTFQFPSDGPAPCPIPDRPKDQGHRPVRGRRESQRPSATAQARKALSPTHSGAPRPQARNRTVAGTCAPEEEPAGSGRRVRFRGGHGAGRAPRPLSPRETGRSPGTASSGGRSRRARRGRAGASPRLRGRRRRPAGPALRPRPGGCSGAFCRPEAEDGGGGCWRGRFWRFSADFWRRPGGGGSRGERDTWHGNEECYCFTLPEPLCGCRLAPCPPGLPAAVVTTGGRGE